jgi:hypothetical protein
MQIYIYIFICIKNKNLKSTPEGRKKSKILESLGVIAFLEKRQLDLPKHNFKPIIWSFWKTD